MSVIEQITTAEQLLAANLQHCELIGGELVMMSPAGIDHGRFASRIVAALENHVSQRGLGVVTTAEAGFQLAHDPDTVRAPDVAFVRAERFPAGGVKGFFPGRAGHRRGSRLAQRSRQRSGGKGARLAPGRLFDGLGRRSREPHGHGPSQPQGHRRSNGSRYAHRRRRAAGVFYAGCENLRVTRTLAQVASAIAHAIPNSQSPIPNPSPPNPSRVG